jgi:hypothetical protein
MAGFKVRQKAKAYSYRKRHLALTSHEQVQSRRIKKFILALMVKQKQEEKIQQLDSSREELFESVLKVLAARYLSIVCVGEEEEQEVERRPSQNRTIESFTASECKINFRFHKEHLQRLMNVLRFPAVVKFQNRRKLRGEEVFLRGLYELCSGNNQEHDHGFFYKLGSRDSVLL